MTTSQKIHLQLVAAYQCPGCVSGPYVDPDAGQQECAAYREFNGGCAGHTIGTHFGLSNRLALGLPTGFNKQQLPARGADERTTTGPQRSSHIDVHMYTSPDAFDMPLNHLNVPVWHVQHDADFFLKVFHARIGSVTICVVRGGDASLVPDKFNAFDVSEFEDTID